AVPAVIGEEVSDRELDGPGRRLACLLADGAADLLCLAGAAHGRAHPVVKPPDGHVLACGMSIGYDLSQRLTLLVASQATSCLPLAARASWAAADLRRNQAHRVLMREVVLAVRPGWLMHGHLHTAYQRRVDLGRRADRGYRAWTAPGPSTATEGSWTWRTCAGSASRASR
ncbi:MAG TPA: hypothetical protein VN969_12905, partial [Streptosporangiaceae bacterium]|nr:hypothetical protein [Streptosporangiaceae bacterium]